MRLKIVFSIAAVALIAAALLVYYQRTQARRQAIQQSQIHLQRGIELYHKKDYIHAQVELRKSLRAYPDEWRTHFYMATVMTQQKRYPLAIPYLEKALSLNPRETKILNAFGVIYFKLGRLDMAKGYFTAALDVNPADSQAKGLLETMEKLQSRAEKAASPAED
jgi:Tfp pilus assembly protein PilF